MCIPLLLSIEASAFGQTSPDPSKLYEEGVPLMQQGDYENGCRKLQESYDIEPKFGRLYTLALCRDLQGRTATALGLYKDYLTGIAELGEENLGKHGERRAKAAERVRALNESVPKLKLVWRSDIPRDIDVQMDGRDAMPQLNTDWPLDPGDHVLTIRRKNNPDKSQTVTLANDQPVHEVDLTPVEVAPVKGEAQAPVHNVPITPVKVPDKPVNGSTPTAQNRSSQRNLGWMWLGVAGGGSVLAAAFAIKAAAFKGDVEEGCPQKGAKLDCGLAGATALEEGTKWADAATTTLALSGGLAVVGLVELTRRAPTNAVFDRRVHVNIGVGQQHGFVTLSGRF